MRTMLVSGGWTARGNGAGPEAPWLAWTNVSYLN